MSLVSRCMKRVCTRAYTRKQKKHGVSAKNAREGCRIVFCNPTCKGTSFGPELKPTLIGPLYRRGKKWRREFQTRRMAFFSKRANILKDGFYIKIPKEQVKQARRRGEISGCYEPL